MSQDYTKGSPQSIPPPTVTASAMLQAGRRPPTRGAPLLCRPRRAHTPAPPAAAPLPSNLKKRAAALESSSAAASSQSADAATLSADKAAGRSAIVDCAPQPVTAPTGSALAALPSASSSEVVPEASSSAAGQRTSSVPEQEPVHDSLATSEGNHLMAKPDAAWSDTELSQQQQQQQQPKCSAYAERPVAEPAAMQACSRIARRDAEETSRPSTSGSKQAATSSFDRRLALLHKGLPSHLPPPSAVTPRLSSRSRRASALGLPAALLHHPSTQLDPNCLLSSGFMLTESKPAVDAPLQGCARNGTTSDATTLHPEQRGDAVVTPSAASEQAGQIWLGKGGNPLRPDINKPTSPTYVLPSQGLGDTTYHSFHGLADAYPELYKAAAAAGRAQKASSRALQCFVGETLKGSPDLWRQGLKSAYTIYNDRLKHDAVGKPCPLAACHNYMCCLHTSVDVISCIGWYKICRPCCSSQFLHASVLNARCRFISSLEC